MNTIQRHVFLDNRQLIIQSLIVSMLFIFGNGSFATTKDSSYTVKSFLQQGDFNIHMRSFFMATQNKGELTDYATMALGAGLSYKTPIYKGFSVGMSGFFTFQLFENNLATIDPTTGNTNRYELLLYDMNDANNKRDLDRLDQLFLQYQYKGINIRLGRHSINTPLLNEQDNRMRPNVFRGATVAYKKQRFLFTNAFFTHVTPRGTVDWYNLSKSVGVYPFGRNIDGEPSLYKHNVSSKGILVSGIEYKDQTVHLQSWNYIADNMFALHFAQLDYKKRNAEDRKLLAGIQGFYQYTLNEGGNADLSKTYRLPNEISSGVGTRIGYEYKNHLFTINSLYLSKTGRFLFPREWGREQFYTSLSRERYEGAGAVQVHTLNYKYKITKHIPVLLNGGVSRVTMPGVNDYKLNKYGVPSYYHYLLGADYHFKKALEGIELKIIVITKQSIEPNEVEDRFRINRVDLWNYNIIVDYHF